MRRALGLCALLCEAAGCIALSSLAIAFTSFRFVTRIAAWRSDIPVRGISSGAAQRMRWAIVAVSERVPWKAVCFQQGLAAHWMLRRRGVASILYYGAMPGSAHGMAAHVWVRAGDVDVVGCEEASMYAVLLTIPPAGGMH